MEVELITEATALAALAPEWEALRRRALALGPFASFEWNRLWWQHHLPPDSLQILALREGGSLRGLAPLCLFRQSGVRILRPLGTGTSDYLDLLAAPGSEEACLRVLLGHLASHAGEWDLLDWPDWPEQSPILPLLHQMRDQAAWSGAILPGAICPYVARPASWESFLSAHSGRFRRKIRWELKRARARGELGFEVTTDLDGDHTLDRLGSLHERRPVGPATSSLLASRRDRAFLREGLRWLSELGALRIPLLRLEGRIISFCVGFVSGRRFYYYLPSFDPDFAALAPGRLLLALLVQAMAELQVDEIDLMKGDEPYKLEWATTYRRGLRVLMHNPRSISRVAYSAVAAFAQFRGRARTVPLARYLRFRLWPLLQQVLRRGVRLG